MKTLPIIATRTAIHGFKLSSNPPKTTESMRNRTFKMMLFACALLASHVQAAVIFDENFESGLGAWTQIQAWETISFDSSTIAQSVTGSSFPNSLTRSFTELSATSFTLDFDFGWAYATDDAGSIEGVSITDAAGSGYMYTIRQAGPDFTYGLYTLTAGVISGSVVSGTGSGAGGQPLENATLSWDGNTLRGYREGVEMISYSANSYDTFSQVSLLNYSTNGQLSRFDNVVLDVSVVPEPQIPALFAVGLLFVFACRKTRFGTSV